jgi:hypothetical protein
MVDQVVAVELTKLAAMALAAMVFILDHRI